MTREESRKRLKTSVTSTFGASLYYVFASTVLVSGLWWPEMLLLLTCAYCFAWRVQARQPKLLVLRRFGDPQVETFLHLIVGGLGIYGRPIWLYDSRAPAPVRRNLPGPWLYATRFVVWVSLGLTVIGLEPDNLPFEVLWVSWMVVGSSVYHRYKAGRSPTSWIACAGAALSVLALSSQLFGPRPVPRQSQWDEAGVMLGLFLVLWVTLAWMLVSTPLKRLFGWMYQRRLIRTDSDVDRYVRELKGKVLLPRYLPVAPIQVAEIVCTPNTWGPAVYESLGVSSAVIADVSNLEETAALTWELQQTHLAGAPMFLTCEEHVVSEVRAVLANIQVPKASLFVWRRDIDASSGVAFDHEKLAEEFSRLIQDHLAEDLAYLPIRPTREEALASMNTINTSTRPSDGTV